MSKSSCELEVYRLDKKSALPKKMSKNVAERLCGPLQPSGVDNNTKFLAADKCSCVHRTCQVSLEHSHPGDYEGNTAL